MTKMSIVSLIPNEGEVLTLQRYQNMLDIAANMVIRNNVRHLYSGGLGWIDHIVVSLGLLGLVVPENITIILPDTLSNKQPGYTLRNKLDNFHRLFSKCIQRDTVSEIALLQERGAKILYSPTCLDSLSDVLSFEDILLVYNSTQLTSRSTAAPENGVGPREFYVGVDKKG